MINIPFIPYSIENPTYLLGIPIAIAFLYFFIRKEFVKFKNIDEKKDFIKNKKYERLFVIIMRSCAVALIFLALSSPFITHEKEIKGDPHVTVMVDNSSSFTIFDQDQMKEFTDTLKKYMPVKIRYIGSDDRSDIGDELINNMQGNGESVLLISDGWATHGSTLDNAFTNAAISEVTINTIDIKPDKSDLSLYVEGPAQNIIGLPSDFIVRVNNVGEEIGYSLRVEIDDKAVLKRDSLSGSYSESFSSNLGQGYHVIKAYLSNANDFFPQNNVYLKTVQILPKPKILLVTESDSPLTEILDNNYNLDIENFIPDDLTDYYAIVLNDLPIEKINPKFDTINEFVTDGDGLIVIGGKNSYEKGGYKDSLFETLLPVRIGTGIKSGASGVNVVIVIDASYSFRGEAIDYAKALAVDVLYNARPQDSVGAIAFRSGGGVGERTKTLVELTKMMNKSPDFEENFVNDIGYIKGAGGTDIYAGLKRAEVILQGKDNVNLIIISDGQQVLNRVNTIKKARALAEKNFKIFTIGYSNAGLNDVDEDFLEDISDSGDGIYTGMDQPLPIEFIFEAGDKGDEEFEEKKTDQGEPLIIADANNWIARGLKLGDATISGYNAIVPKKSAHGILYTITANNVLSAWNFGLGRVVAYGTDDGKYWSGPILSGNNSILIPKMVNWAIEDPDRKDRFNVNLEDTRIGAKTIVRVHTDLMPELQDFVFRKTDDREYTTEYYPAKREVRDFFGYKQAVNYPLEFRDVGMNPHFLNLIRKGTFKKGKIFRLDDIEGLVEKIKEDSVIIEPITTYIRWPFALVALCIFLTEICIRRIRQYMQ